MAKKRCKKRSRLTRGGVVISSTFHWFRLVLFSLLLAFLAWYGHQKYTNPFIFHPQIEIYLKDGKPHIHLFRANYSDTTDGVVITTSPTNISNGIVISDSSISWSSDSTIFTRLDFDSTGTVSLYNKIISIKYEDYSIVIPFTESVSKQEKPIDVLIIQEYLINDLATIRVNFSPKLTFINENRNNSLKNMPQNVILLRDKRSYIVDRGKHKELTAQELY